MKTPDAASDREAIEDAILIGHWRDATDSLPARSRLQRWRQGWWPPALRRALYSWQQTCDEQEMELATLRGIVAEAQAAVDSFDRKPTEGNVRDVIGLAESLRRYREMRDSTPKPSLPHISQSRSVA